ncbi:MAG: GntR family transcriptional regulator [Acidobacteria bacterium]|nr:GntR family transcriptional regulator [Acidobacteriota bacterium]
MRDNVTFDGFAIIDRKSPIPYYFQLSSHIEAKIKAKEWHPGQFLPSEEELCNSVGVSRTVVRQAMAELERKGMIAKQNGKRSSIAFPKYEGGLMQTLSGFYEDALAKGQEPSTKVLEFKVIPARAEVAEALKLSEGEPVVMLNRLRSLNGEPEVLVITYLPLRKCSTLLEEDFTNQSLYEVLKRKYGLRITQGFRTIEAIALDRSDARLLGLRGGTPALLLKSVGMLEDGTPLEYFIAKHRGDRSKFEVRLVRS